MLEKEFVISNKLGLHTRASAKLIALTSKYISNIELVSNDKSVNGKSIIELLTLGLALNSKVIIKIDGPDEEEMMTAVDSLINNKFDEGE